MTSPARQKSSLYLLAIKIHRIIWMEGVGSEVYLAAVGLVAILVAGYVVSPAVPQPAAQQRGAPRPGAEEEPCGICLDVHENMYMVQTNCRHIFCSECVIQYWRRNPLQRISCPICRSQVSTFFPLGPHDLQADVLEYNRVSNSSGYSMLHFVRELPMLFLSFIRGVWNADAETSRRLVRSIGRIRVYAWTIFTICYFLSPFDLLPESVLGIFGLIDDVIIILLVLVHLLYVYRTMVLLRQRHGT